MNSKINVLLTGASGTVGSDVLQQLAQLENINLTVFDQKAVKSKRIFATYKDHINVIYGDLTNEKDVATIPDKLDIVIHLAAIIPLLADVKPELTRKVNVIGTKTLLNRLEMNSPNAFFMYSSSISVYGDRVVYYECSEDI